MAEKSNEQKNALKDVLLGNKNTLIIAVIVIALIVAIVPIAIIGCSKDDPASSDTQNTGEVLSGTYAIEIANAGSSKYIFDGDKVTNIYNDTTVEYTYVIAIEDGVRVIKLTTLDEDGEKKTTTHEFYEGSMGDRAFISINDSYYYLVENEQ